MKCKLGAVLGLSLAMVITAACKNKKMSEDELAKYCENVEVDCKGVTQQTPFGQYVADMATGNGTTDNPVVPGAVENNQARRCIKKCWTWTNTSTNSGTSTGTSSGTGTDSSTSTVTNTSSGTQTQTATNTTPVVD